MLIVSVGFRHMLFPVSGLHSADRTRVCFEDIDNCKDSKRCKDIRDDYMYKCALHAELMKIASNMLKISKSENMETSFQGFQHMSHAIDALEKQIPEATGKIDNSLHKFIEKYSLKVQATPLLEGHLGVVKDFALDQHYQLFTWL